MRGNVNALIPYAIIFVVVGIVIGFGAQIVDKMNQTTGLGTTAHDILGNALTSLSTFGEWLPTLALIVVAVIVIGILLNQFAGMSGGGA